MSLSKKFLASGVETLLDKKPIEVSSLVHESICPLPVHFSNTLYGDLIDENATFKAQVKDVLILAFIASQGYQKSEVLFEVLLLDDQDSEKELLLRVVVDEPQISAVIGYPEDF